MDARETELRFYRTSDGREPFVEWLDELRDARARQKIQARLVRVRLGNFGDCEPVGQGVLELKINFGPGYRIYFGRDGNEIVILLCAGDKSSQQNDIKNAKACWEDYKREKNHADL